jgi:hypothetical protein
VPVTPMPRRAPAPVPVSVSAPHADSDRLTARSDIQSSALSELRGLYQPAFTPEVAPPAEVPSGGLTRRTARAVDEDATTTITPAPAAPVRTRSAAEVRGMLSGFRAGVERGRGSADATDPADTTETPTS